MTLPPEIETWVLPADAPYDRMNDWGARRIPFVFAIDYAAKRPFALPLSEVTSDVLLYQCPIATNAASVSSLAQRITLTKHPEEFEVYSRKFERVREHLDRGDTYLLNLTCRTPIDLDVDLRTLFASVGAKYKLCVGTAFAVFSPECFVRIENDRIYSYPMKGTIDASLPNAEERVLADDKETAEHYTIVDLIRNDLSQVAEGVRVESFRHVSHIRTRSKDLLHVSSTIAGELGASWRSRIGSIFRALLPAGSVTGAPKQKTCEIIDATEDYDRGFYTGVFGVFDGERVDSGVMIRFIEREEDGYIFKSGGGVTVNSDAQAEYQEMIDKVYVPLL